MIGEIGASAAYLRVVSFGLSSLPRIWPDDPPRTNPVSEDADTERRDEAETRGAMTRCKWIGSTRQLKEIGG